ncbi:MAG: magnesium/cobalt transporter CorA [Gemmataceae bacterium]|nr:magnesium/cobalt transporter CorA [Gemmataceae bacterium]
MLTVIRWNETDRNCREFDFAAAREIVSELQSTADPIWFDLRDPSDEELAFVFGSLIPIHSLSLEDINRPSRDPQGRPHLPKVEEFPNYLFIIVNPLTDAADDPESEEPLTSQLGAVITRDRLVTVHAGPCKSVEAVRVYLARHGEQARRGPDFVFHLILDSMVDAYAPLLDTLSDRLDEMEVDIFGSYSRDTLPRLLHLKRRLTHVRKTLAFEREVLARLARGDFELIDEREMVYYRNVYDHLVRFTELSESGREMVSDLLQTHLSVVSNRLNEVMKTLTMVSTVVLPMSIITGMYGMNFKYFPEIEWPWGYPFALALMAIAGLTPLAWFRWKRWL